MSTDDRSAGSASPESDDTELGFRVISWLNAENIYGWGAWEEIGERLPA